MTEFLQGVLVGLVGAALVDWLTMPNLKVVSPPSPPSGNRLGTDGANVWVFNAGDMVERR